MTPLSRKTDEVVPGDLVKVKTLYTDKCHFYLVIDIEEDEDPTLVTYKVFHEGKIVKMRKMKRLIPKEGDFVVSRSEDHSTD